jgi:hypothetical protein
MHEEERIKISDKERRRKEQQRRKSLVIQNVLHKRAWGRSEWTNPTSSMDWVCGEWWEAVDLMRFWVSEMSVLRFLSCFKLHCILHLSIVPLSLLSFCFSCFLVSCFLLFNFLSSTSSSFCRSSPLVSRQGRYIENKSKCSGGYFHYGQVKAPSNSLNLWFHSQASWVGPWKCC